MGSSCAALRRCRMMICPARGTAQSSRVNTPPTPRQLFRLLDQGAITREQFREAMAVHTRQIIGEMEEAQRNSFASWVETLRNKRAAARLIHRHSETLVREIFVALSELPDFPVANWLWNADSPRVPLHCFLRSRHEPVFRVLQITSVPMEWTVTVEHGSAVRGKTMREKFIITRDRLGAMFVQERDMLA